MNFASQELKVKYKRSVLGFLWSLLNPILTMTVTSVVFAAVMRFKLNNFVVFIYSGLLPWGFIAISMEGATNSLINAEGYIKKIYLPKLIFPIAGVLSNFINMLLSMAALFIILLFIGVKVRLPLLFLPVSFVLVFIATAGIAMLLSTVAVFFRDIRHIIGVVTGALFYLTPILYPLKYIPTQFVSYIELNPFYYLIQLFRDPIYYGILPPLSTVLTATGISIVSISVGIAVFSRFENNFVYRL